VVCGSKAGGAARWLAAMVCVRVVGGGEGMYGRGSGGLHTCIHIHIHTYICIHTHTCVHTHACARSRVACAGGQLTTVNISHVVVNFLHFQR
jgi:hypothetical protein